MVCKGKKGAAEEMKFFIMPQISYDTFVLPLCFRFVRNGRAEYKDGAIDNCDFISIEVFNFRLVIGVIK